MQLNVDVTVVSFILGIVSLAVGVLAMVLSALFYFKSTELVLETTRTLGEIRQTTKSLEASVQTIISRTIDYLTGGARTSQAELKKGAVTADEVFERVEAALGVTDLGQKVDDLENAFKDLQKLYADAQTSTARRELGAGAFVTSTQSPQIGSREEYVEFLRKQGWDRYLMGDLDGSIEFSRRALDEDPDDLFARPNLALALLLNGERQEALAHYDQFLRQFPQSRHLWYAIGDLEHTRGSGADGIEEALQLLRAGAKVADSDEEHIDSEDEIPF